MILDKTGLKTGKQNITAKLSPTEINDMETFIKEELLAKWYADTKSDFHPVLFARRLVGRKRLDWENTKLKVLNDWYRENPHKKNKANNSSIDVGHILWNVLLKEGNVFYTNETKIEGNRPYWLIDSE